MKIRTLDDLADKLDEDLGWRRLELQLLLSNARTTKDMAQRCAVRAGISLLYAHWEGYLKYSSEIYLIFVTSQKYNYDQLQDNFLAIKFYLLFQECKNSNKIASQQKIIEFIRNDFLGRAFIPCDGVIRTGANLNSEFLQDILFTIGLDKSLYELKHNLIDAKLLKYRNEIVHGQFTHVDLADFENLVKEVLFILSDFNNQLQNAASLKSFLI